MKFMIDVVMLRNSVALLVYDYVLIVAGGSRIYAHRELVISLVAVRKSSTK